MSECVCVCALYPGARITHLRVTPLVCASRDSVVSAYQYVYRGHACMRACVFSTRLITQHTRTTNKVQRGAFAPIQSRRTCMHKRATRIPTVQCVPPVAGCTQMNNSERNPASQFIIPIFAQRQHACIKTEIFCTPHMCAMLIRPAEQRYVMLRAHIVEHKHQLHIKYSSHLLQLLRAHRRNRSQHKHKHGEHSRQRRPCFGRCRRFFGRRTTTVHVSSRVRSSVC